jgi:DNA-binding CsgD family transcriptional regulator
VYDGSRYLTVTGHHIEGTAPDLTPQPEALNWLHETHMIDRFALEEEAQRPPSQAHDPALLEAARRVLEKAFSAANGNKVKTLYEGRWRELGYPSQSDADLALVSTLTFWTCDEDLLDHLFRQSALMRTKWEEKHYADGTTYGKATLIEALKGRGQGYRWETQSNAFSRSEKLKGGKDRKTCVIAVTLSNFLRRELPKQEAILSPWLLKQSLNMIYAWRGVGKTHVALGIAYAVAAGGRFLSWQAEIPHGVLYIDGEMPAAAMQQRLSQIVLTSEKEATPDLFRIITPDLQDNFMPDLATIEGQEAIDEHITDDTQLIVIDNLSSLVRRGGRENDAESWLGVAEWAMAKRAQGKSLLFLHHAGKSGAQRGTSKREDILDTVICLRRPSDYDPAQEGARFEVIFEKNRHKADVEPFEAALTTDPSGRQVWLIRSIEQYRDEQILELYELGLSMPDIADELGINKSTVSRALHRMEKEGRVTLGKGRRESKLQGARA